MFQREQVKGRIWLGALVLAGAFAVVPAAQAGTCYGTWFDYFETPAFVNIVGSKVVCPGYPDQVDEDENGNSTETPYFQTQTVVCPCPGNGGGGGGGGGGIGDTDDSDADEDAPG